MLFMHFSVDSYGLYFEVDKNAPIISGRLIFYLFCLICEKTGFNPVAQQGYLTFAFILLTTYAATKIAYIFYPVLNLQFRNNVLKWIILDGAILIGFINSFYLEWFLFPEITFIYGLAILFLVVAVEKTIENSSLILPSGLLFLGLNCYQAIFPIYIILSVTRKGLEYNLKISKKAIKDIIKILCIAGSAAILQLLELKALKEVGYERNNFLINQENLILDNIKIIINEQIPLWYSAFGFLPSLILVMFSCIIFILIIFRLKENNLEKKDILFNGILFLGCYMSIFVLGMFSSTVWLAPRTIPGFFFIFSMLFFITLFMNQRFYIVEKIICSLIIAFLLINFIQIQDIARNHYISLALNEQEAILIEKQIEKYEETSGKTITNIAVKNDSNPTWGYKNVKYNQFDTNMRAFSVSWTAVPCLNYYTGNRYTQVAFPDTIYQQFGKDCDWTELNLEEQMLFVDDTVYLMSY